MGEPIDDPTARTASVRSNGVLSADPAVQKPRWAFWKGLLTGAAIEVPLLATTVWLLARLGFGNPDVAWMRMIRITAVFAGVAALLTAGGIGRLAAYAVVDGGRRLAIWRAVRAHAIAGAGLVLIAAIPHGHMPGHSYGWLAFLGGGLVCGAIAGAAIGLVCSAPTALAQLADVWSLARRPSAALRNLLDADDLVRLGSALRARTTNLFEGIFDPAAREPAPPAPPAATPAPPAEAAADAAPASDEPAPPSPPPRISV